MARWRRRALVVVATGLVAALTPAGAPVGAQTGPTGPVWLTIDSDPGDDIGQGTDRAYVPADADFRVYTYDRGLQVVVAGAETWRISLLRPSATAQLAVGRYEAVAWPDRGPADGGLDVSAGGRGCGRDDVSGWFEIDDIAYSAGVATRLAARFEHTCAPDEAPGTGGTLRGQVRWDGSQPLPTNHIPPSPVPPTFPAVPAGALPGSANAMWLSRPQVTTPDGQPFSVTGALDMPSIRPTDAGPEVEATGQFPAQTVVIGVRMRLRLSSRQPAFVPGLYEDQLSAWDNPVLGGFETSPGVGGTCPDGTGGADVAVDEIDLGPDETSFEDLSIRWLIACGGTVKEQGAIRYQRPVPAGTPAAPTGVTAVAGADTTVVSWVAPTSGPTATGYVVTTFVDGLATETPVSVSAGSTSAVVPTPDAGLHTFKVAAVGTAGTGLRSAASAPVAVPGPDLGPLPTIAAFVRQQHRDFAGRQPTTAELQAMSRALARGEVTPQEVVRDLRGRATLSGRRAAVARLYRAAFGRIPDADGLDYWVQRIAAGTSIGRVADMFVASPELRRRYGSLTAPAFVDQLYQNVLGRSADAGGKAFWLGQLETGWSRGRVLLSFASSPENVARTAADVETITTFVAMLGRVPTNGEMLDGRSAASAQLVRGLLASPEYAARIA